MPGMLAEAQNIQPPSSGPGPQIPPAGNPGAGAPLPGGASGPGQPAGPEGQPAEPGNMASFEELRDRGVQRLYGENFDQLINMFQTNGASQFPRSMAIAVNSTLDYLEQDGGNLPKEMAAKVGMDIMMKLLEDIIGDGVVPDVTLEQVQQAFPAILVMYADAHPEVSKQDVQDLVKEVQLGMSQQKGGAPSPEAPPESAAALSTGPAPPPGNTPVPPGAV